MSKTRITCPRCQHIFEEEKQELYECPKCGTNIREKTEKTSEEPEDFDKTQIFEH